MDLTVKKFIQNLTESGVMSETGIVAFQEKNPYEARVYFSRLVSTCQREEFENELDNPVDMAQHYLKLLDKREFKRSHFRLISS